MKNLLFAAILLLSLASSANSQTVESLSKCEEKRHYDKRTNKTRAVCHLLTTPDKFDFSIEVNFKGQTPTGEPKFNFRFTRRDTSGIEITFPHHKHDKALYITTDTSRLELPVTGYRSIRDANRIGFEYGDMILRTEHLSALLQAKQVTALFGTHKFTFGNEDLVKLRAFITRYRPAVM